MLRLRHRGLGPDDVEAHGDGWMHYLNRLAIAAAGGDPGPDANAAHQQPSATPAAST
jgi:hypothetical protein